MAVSHCSANLLNRVSKLKTCSVSTFLSIQRIRFKTFKRFNRTEQPFLTCGTQRVRDLFRRNSKIMKNIVLGYFKKIKKSWVTRQFENKLFYRKKGL
jgi:hypothetical protein